MNLKKKRKGGEECKQEIDEIQKQCEIKSTRPRKRERKESGGGQHFLLYGSHNEEVREYNLPKFKIICSWSGKLCFIT